MSKQIKETLYNKMPIHATEALAKALIRFVAAYETRGTHPAAFNTPFLGIDPCAFINSDRDDYFALFSMHEEDMKKNMKPNNNEVFGVKTGGLLAQAAKVAEQENTYDYNAMKRHVNSISSINKSFKVVSDPLNIMLIYTAHVFMVSDIKQQIKEQAVVAVLMYLQYKFFTSLSGHRFRYKPDINVMRAMFEGLSNKFDIKRLGTWRSVIEERAKAFIAKGSIHYDTLVKFDDDAKILYVITDLQSRLRNQVNIITEEFMKAKENKNAITIYSNIGTDIDGDKTLMACTDSYDMAIASVYNDCLSRNRILDQRFLRGIVGMFSSISYPMLNAIVIGFSELATRQAKEKTSDDVVYVNDLSVPVGAHAVVQHIIQKSYRYCAQKGVAPDRRGEVLKIVKEVYGNSRIADPGIVAVKEAVSRIVSEYNKSTREATVAALRIGFIMYIVCLSFKYMK